MLYEDKVNSMKKWIVICFWVWLIYPVMAGSLFDDIDLNKDGYISWEEFQTVFPNLKKAAFDAIDTNKDGKISCEEWEHFQKLHRQGVKVKKEKKEMNNVKMYQRSSEELTDSEQSKTTSIKSYMKPLVQPPVTK